MKLVSTTLVVLSMVLILTVFCISEEPGRSTGFPGPSGMSDKWLGIGFEDPDELLRNAMELGDRNGVVVSRVFAESSSGKVGISTGDFITAFNGIEITSARKLIELVLSSNIGDEATITLYRGGKKKNLDVTIEQRVSNLRSGEGVMPPQFPGGGSASPSAFPGTVTAQPFFPGTGTRRGVDMGVFRQGGMTLYPLNENLAEYFKIKDAKGLLILDVEKDCAVYNAGIEAGDVIIKIAGKEVYSAEDAKSVSQGTGKDMDSFDFSLIKKGKAKTITVKPIKNASNENLTRNQPFTDNIDVEMDEKINRHIELAFSKVESKIDSLLKKLEKIEGETKAR